MEPSPGDKTICLPFASEEHYQQCLADRGIGRQYLEQLWQQHPELFPAEMDQGFSFYGTYASAKQQLNLRRIKLRATQEVYQMRPSFVMPYMIARTEEIEKALYLRQWGVPFDALAYVFGRDAMFWYRAWLALGQPSLVGTTVKDPETLPVHLVADEKHTWLRGEKVYLTTTVAQGCILGAGVVPSAGTEDLEQGYGQFAQEARQLSPTYAPETVCTDGWEATRAAWKKLFPMITLILCFLHSVLKILDRCQRDAPWRATLKERAWHVYRATTRGQFAQRLRRFREWAQAHVPAGLLREAVLALCLKAPSFAAAYAFPQAHRTSNAVDRLMDQQDRLLYAMRYFHGTLTSATRAARAQALLWNFHPFGARTRRADASRSSPFGDLNGFHYHDNWLHNLLIAASLGGRRTVPT